MLTALRVVLFCLLIAMFSAFRVKTDMQSGFVLGMMTTLYISFEILFSLYQPIVGWIVLSLSVCTALAVRYEVCHTQPGSKVMFVPAPILFGFLFLTSMGIFLQVAETVCGKFF